MSSYFITTYKHRKKIPAVPFTSWASLSKLYNLSVPQLPHLLNRDDGSPHHGVLVGTEWVPIEGDLERPGAEWGTVCTMFCFWG